MLHAPVAVNVVWEPDVVVVWGVELVTMHRPLDAPPLQVQDPGLLL